MSKLKTYIYIYSWWSEVLMAVLKCEQQKQISPFGEMFVCHKLIRTYAGSWLYRRHNSNRIWQYIPTNCLVCNFLKFPETSRQHKCHINVDMALYQY